MLPGPALAATALSWLLHLQIGLLLTAVPVMAPALAADLGVEPALVGYYSALIWATAMVLSPITGAVIERLGPIRAMQVGFALLAVGAAIGAIKLVVALAVTAILIGVVSTIEAPSSSALLIRLVPRASLNIVLSIKQTGFQLGAVLGGLIYPFAVVAFGWSHSLLALVPVFIFSILLVDWFRRRDARRAEPGSGRRPVTRRLTTLRLVLRDPALRALSLVSMSYSAVQLCLNTCFVTYAVTELHLPLPTAAAALAATQAMGFVGRIMWGAVADRLISTMNILILVGVVMGLLMLVLGLAPPGNLPALFALTMLMGLTVSGWNGVFMAEVARRSPPDQVASTTAGVLTAGHIGLTIGPLAFTATAEAIGFGRAYAILALVALLGAAKLAWNARSLPRA